MSAERVSRLRVTQAVLRSVAAVAAGVLIWALPAAVRFGLDAPSGFWAMALAATIVDAPLFGVLRREDPRVRTTLSVCFTFAIFVLWGPAPAVVVQAIAASVSAIGQRYQVRPGIYLVARLVCAAAAAELVVALADPRPITTAGAGLDGGDLLAFTLLAAVWFGVSYGLLVVVRAAISPDGFLQASAEARFDLFGTAALVLVVSPLLTTFTGWWALLIAVPLMVWNGLARVQLRHEEWLGREPVSGLLNRQGFAGGLKSITYHDLVTPSGPPPFGIIMVNVESALDINRTLGRDVYEQVVAVASRRLVEAYGEDRAGRLSGEALSILVPDLTEADALQEAQAVVRLLTPPIDVDDIPFALDPAAGVALSPQHGRDLGTLLAKADLAVSEARRQGVRAMVYVRQAADVTQRRLTLLRDLRAALEDPARHHEVGVLYQPQVRLRTGQLSGVEALLRWTHPQWGPVPTDQLIEAAEPSDVMHVLTLHVLGTVAAQMRQWTEQGRPLRVAVNISVQDLHQPEFVAEVGQLLRRHAIPPELLTIEITERMLIADQPGISRACGDLVGLGVGLSLDDFGTGHASMQQLRQLPLTEVKIDRSYVSGIVDNPADLAIVRSVHELARALRVEVVAEGVEDQRTADTLATLAGAIGQGWYFARPMTADALRGWQPSSPPPRPG